MSYMVHIMTSNINFIKNCDREMTAKKKPFWNKLKKKKNCLTYPDSYFESLAENVWLDDSSSNGSIITGAPGCSQQQRKPQPLWPNKAPFAIFISCFGTLKKGNQR